LKKNAAAENEKATKSTGCSVCQFLVLTAGVAKTAFQRFIAELTAQPAFA
jgi:hypothetical protein